MSRNIDNNIYCLDNDICAGQEADNGQTKCTQFRQCFRYIIHNCCCITPQPGPDKPLAMSLTNGSLPCQPGGEGDNRTVSVSRSVNALYTDHSPNTSQDIQKKWNSNGYQATSRSTDDLLEEVRSKLKMSPPTGYPR